VYFYSLQWARLFATFGKRHEKHLPQRFFCANPQYLNGLLDGLVDSDGCIGSDGRISFRNTSQKLLNSSTFSASSAVAASLNRELKSLPPEDLLARATSGVGFHIALV